MALALIVGAYLPACRRRRPAAASQASTALSNSKVAGPLAGTFLAVLVSGPLPALPIFSVAVAIAFQRQQQLRQAVSHAGTRCHGSESAVFRVEQGDDIVGVHRIHKAVPEA